VLLCVLGLSAQAQQHQGIAAIVNDDIISLHDLNSRISLFLATSNLADTPENRARLAPDVLRTLIDDKLKRQEMRRQNISVSQAELDRALTQIAGQVRIQPSDLPRFLASRGVGMPTLIDQLETEIGWQMAVSRIAADRAVISPNEVDEELARVQGSREVEYRLAEVFLPIDDPADQPRVEELAMQLVAETRSGANFPTLARTFSQGPSAADGGDLGWVSRQELDPQIESVVARLQPGEVSEPIRAQGGYFILFLAARRSGDGAADGPKVIMVLQQVFLPLPRTASDPEVSDRAKQAGEIAAGAASCSDLAQRGRAAGAAVGNPAPVDLQQLPPELRQLIAPLRVGEMTPPVRSTEGFLVLMVCDRQEQAAEGDQRTAIERRLREQRLSAVGRRELRDLRRAALLDIRV
jgi:peptidyl-prolyl cis-trans isomerase SurA